MGADLLLHFYSWGFLVFPGLCSEIRIELRRGLIDRLSFLGTQIPFLYLQHVLYFVHLLWLLTKRPPQVLFQEGPPALPFDCAQGGQLLTIHEGTFVIYKLYSPGFLP